MTANRTRIAIAVAAIAAAFAAGTASVSSALARSNPVLAGAMPIAAGPALARATRLYIAKELAAAAKDGPTTIGGFPVGISPRVRDLALKAFLGEPLETDALFALGLALPPEPGAARARDVYRQTQKLSRRHEGIALWLAQDAARRSDISGTLRHFDQVLRTSREARPAILQQFALATSEPRFMRGMVGLMEANPPWTMEYWRAGAELPRAAAAMAQLRLNLIGKGVPFDDVADQKIANNLIGQDQFDLAARLYAGAAGQRATRTTVRNDDFQLPSFMPPVDWETYSSGDFGSEIAFRDGVLLAYASSYPGGTVARQWVRLVPRSHRISASVRLFPGAEEDRASLRLTCMADARDSRQREFPLSDGRMTATFEPFSDCRDYWLDVHLVPAERSPGLEVEIESIAITPANP